MATSQAQWIIEAEIMPKRGVNDPQGDAVFSGLKQLGFTETDRVRVGKLIRVDVHAANEEEARSRGEAMCEKLLANMVIEEYELKIHPGAQE